MEWHTTRKTNITRVFLLAMIMCNIPALLIGQQQPLYEMTAAEPADGILIGRDHPGAAGNKQGFEGGTVFRHQGWFHMFVTEEVTGWAQTRTGYWRSKNGKTWERVSTVQTPAPPEAVNDARYSIWSPMPVYNASEKRWNLFYVGYETKGTIHGRVFRAVSQQAGPGAVAGPYEDVEGTVIAYTDSNRNNWEGVQGTDSFFPFRVGKKWLAFYGSSNAASYWHAGLAEADSLEGTWKRRIAPPTFSKAENPVVTRLANGDFIAVFDDLQQLAKDNKIGYAWSKDGLSWHSSSFAVSLPPGVENIRTAQSIIPADKKNTYWIYFTANTGSRFDIVSRVKVKLKKIKTADHN